MIHGTAGQVSVNYRASTPVTDSYLPDLASPSDNGLSSLSDMAHCDSDSDSDGGVPLF
jgi:hypothetical protein